MSDTAGGSYNYMVAGGSVGGTWAEASTTHGSENESVSWLLGGDDVWTKTGTGSDSNSSNAIFSDAVSSSYMVATEIYSGTGNITESGSDTWLTSDSSSYNTLPD